MSINGINSLQQIGDLLKHGSKQDITQAISMIKDIIRSCDNSDELNGMLDMLATVSSGVGNLINDIKDMINNASGTFSDNKSTLLQQLEDMMKRGVNGTAGISANTMPISAAEGSANASGSSINALL